MKCCPDLYWHEDTLWKSHLLGLPIRLIHVVFVSFMPHVCIFTQKLTQNKCYFDSKIGKTQISVYVEYVLLIWLLNLRAHMHSRFAFQNLVSSVDNVLPVPSLYKRIFASHIWGVGKIYPISWKFASGHAFFNESIYRNMILQLKVWIVFFSCYWLHRFMSG